MDIEGLNIQDLYSLLKLIKDYEDTYFEDVNLDTFLNDYNYFIKNIYSIDNPCKYYEKIKIHVSKLISKQYDKNNNILGNFEYTVTNGNVQCVNIDFLKLISNLITNVNIDSEITEVLKFNHDKYIVTRNETDYDTEDYFEVVKLDHLKFDNKYIEFIKWLNSEIEMQKGNLFQTRLREDILASYLPPMDLRRPVEDIDIIVTPNFSKFSKLLPEKIGIVMNIIEHSQVTKHPYIIFMTLFNSLKSIYHQDFYNKCMFHRQYSNDKINETVLPILKQHFSGYYYIIYENEIRCKSNDPLEIILKWIEYFDKHFDFLNFIKRNSLIKKSIDTIMF
jgi:hypothetical protein